MIKTTKYFMELSLFSSPQDEAEKEYIMSKPDDLWFSQFKVTEQLDALRNLMSAQHFDKLDQLRKELKEIKWTPFIEDMFNKHIDSVLDKFSVHGLVDTNKVAGEESPSQASGLRVTKEGVIPSKPNNDCCIVCGLRFCEHKEN